MPARSGGSAGTRSTGGDDGSRERADPRSDSPANAGGARAPASDPGPFQAAVSAVPPALVDDLRDRLTAAEGPPPPDHFLRLAIAAARGDVAAAAAAFRAADFRSAAAAVAAARGDRAAAARAAAAFVDRIMAGLADAEVDEEEEGMEEADDFAEWRGLAGGGGGGAASPRSPPPPPAGAPPDPVVPRPELFDTPDLGPDAVEAACLRGPFPGAPPPVELPGGAAWRGPDGHLAAPDPSTVPASLPPAAPLRFPLVLGTVVIPCRHPAPATARAAAALRLPVDSLEAGISGKRAAAAARAKDGHEAGGGDGGGEEGRPSSASAGWAPLDLGGGPLVAGSLRSAVWRARGTLPRPSGGGGGKRAEAAVPLGPDTPAASVACALARLAAREVATLSARFMPLDGSEAPGVGLAVQVALTEEAFSTDLLGHDDADAARPAFPSKPIPRADARALGCALHAILTLGDGLRVGPDCNGALNLLDDQHGHVGGGARPLPRLAGAARDVPTLLGQCGLSPGAPSAPRPPGLATTPLPHQLTGLRWMVDREAVGDARGHGGAALHPLWVQLVSADGQVFHAFRGGSEGVRLSPRLYTSPFLRAGHTAGGILCDAMGVGKSLEVLSLVLARRPPPGWAVTPSDAGDGWADRVAPVRAALAATSAAAAAAGAATVAATAASRAARAGGGHAGSKPLPPPPPPDPVPVKATLVVAPANLVGQWLDQVRSHVSPGALVVGVYQGAPASARLAAAAAAGTGAGASRDGSADGGTTTTTADDACRPARAAAKRARAAVAGRYATSAILKAAAEAAGGPSAPSSATSPADGAALAWCVSADDGASPIPLAACDLVLMSYEDLRSELGWRARSPLLRLGLWRLCLDEAQLVANSSSVAAAMASSLWRRHAWVVTGTPVSASLDELRGLLEFLGVEPFYGDKAWRTLGLTAVGGPSAPLAALLRVVALRRTQAEANLGLPPCTRRDVSVSLSTVERAAYDAAKARLASAASVVRGGRRGPAALHRLRALYVALRQTACHPQAGARAAALLGVVDRGGPVDHAAAMGGGERLPMASIMARLVKRTAGEADACLRALVSARMVEAGAAIGRGGQLGDAGGLTALLAAVGAEAAALLGAGAGDASAAARAAAARRAGDDGGLAPGWAGVAGPVEGASVLGAALAGAGVVRPEGGGGAALPPARRRGGGKKRGRGTPGPAADPNAPALPPATERACAWVDLFLDGLDLLAEVWREQPGGREEADGLEAAAEGLRAALTGKGSGGEEPPQPPPAAEVADAHPDAAAADAAAVAAAADAADALRFSRRARGMAVNEALNPAAAAALEADRAAARAAANVFMRTARAARARAAARLAGLDPDADGLSGAAASGNLANVPAKTAAYASAWHGLKHALRTQAEHGAGGGAQAAGAAVAGAGHPAGAAAEADDSAAPPAAPTTCPICFDALEPGSTAVTPCAHAFCAGCLGEALALRRACPVCRRPLAPGDVAVARPETSPGPGEGEGKRGDADDGPLSDAQIRADFGAKLAATVAAAHEARAAGGKLVVFSTWARLLKLAAEALHAAGLATASLAGAGPAARASALTSFRLDPDCAALMVVLSTAGGAAGLSLQAATHVVLLEPQLNPGLEAQAASRVHRLGQTRATAVYRLVASRTIDEPIVEEAAARAAAAGGGGGGGAGEEAGPEDEANDNGVGAGEAAVDESLVLRLLDRHP